MRKIRFIKHRIIDVLKSVETGGTVEDVCREVGVSEATYYNWKAKYGGMESSDIKKLKVSYSNRQLGILYHCVYIHEIIFKDEKLS